MALANPIEEEQVSEPDNTRNVQIQEIDIPPEGREVHLKAYGLIKVFKIVAKDGDIEYWATDLLEMDEVNRDKLGGHFWKIEEYHRGIKQFLGVESCQARNKSKFYASFEVIWNNAIELYENASKNLLVLEYPNSFALTKGCIGSCRPACFFQEHRFLLN